MDIIQRLKDLGEQVLKQLKAGEEPSVEIPSRSKKTVQLKDGVLKLKGTAQRRRLLNVQQAKKFVQTIVVAARCKEYLKNDKHTSLRGLYYQLKYRMAEIDDTLFHEQKESNPIVEDLEAMLGVSREALNITSDRRGVVAGPMIIEDRFGGQTLEIDLTKQGRSGWPIPSDVDKGIKFKSINAKAVVVVEKDAIWQRLNEDQFWQKGYILITPKGQPSRGCRRLVRRLADQGLPIYIFTDGDPWGWYIYWTFKTGSINLAHLNHYLATPEVKFIGVEMDDLENFPFLKRLTIPLNGKDMQRIKELLNYPWLDGYWRDQLSKMQRAGVKIEQDALLALRLDFVADYIQKKINRLDLQSGLPPQ